MTETLSYDIARWLWHNFPGCFSFNYKQVVHVKEGQNNYITVCLFKAGLRPTGTYLYSHSLALSE